MNLQNKFGEILSIIKGIITLLVFRGLATWCHSGEAGSTDSSTRHTFDISYIIPPNMNPKSSIIFKPQSGRGKYGQRAASSNHGMTPGIFKFPSEAPGNNYLYCQCIYMLGLL
jgi:hypothetical protein